MNVHIISPLSDCRWDDLAARNPRATAFHRRAWLEALTRTYGYEPFALTSASPGQALDDGMVFCYVSSWITGVRCVSLPFADHCEPLVEDLGHLAGFIAWLQAERQRQGWKYIEVRPLLQLQDVNCGLRPSRSYFVHELDLAPPLEHIFRRLHRASIQRRIQRAEKERLSYESGRTDQLLKEFYALLLITRRRHKLLPQPRSWFRNLLECMGETVQIRVARKGNTPIAAILTLRHRSCVIYKYGCSDERFHNLGGMPLLFWRLIEECKADAVEKIDFGRSDLDNEGLIRFKDNFGTTKRLLIYYRCPDTEMDAPTDAWDSRVVRQIFSQLPRAASALAGRVLYRHFG